MKLEKPLRVARPRGSDSYGSGEFGASRGNRLHVGLDLIAEEGEPVMSPVDGFAVPGYCYGDDPSYRYIKIITNSILVRVMYVVPAVIDGDVIGEVRAGDVIGHAMNVCYRYPGITNHIHLDVALPPNFALVGKLGKVQNDFVYISPRLVMDVDD